jgi:hypothetical protein
MDMVLRGDSFRASRSHTCPLGPEARRRPVTLVLPTTTLLLVQVQPQLDHNSDDQWMTERTRRQEVVNAPDESEEITSNGEGDSASLG